MVSLLEKIGEQKNEIRQQSEIENSPLKNAPSENAGSGIENSPASPCPGCGSPIAWWDRYGGGPHCHRCRDWPTAAVVRAVAVAVNGRWMTFAGANASLEGREIREGEIIQPGAADTSCGHRRRRNVARCFVVSREGAVEVDADRLAEQERFSECLDCGQLVSRI